MGSQQTYRRVSIDAASANTITVGIETENGQTKAVVWWDAKPGIEAGEQEHLAVEDAFVAAEAARALNGCDEVVVVLQSDDLWDARWGRLIDTGREPIGDLRNTDLNEAEAFDLAAGLEAERDA
jgi:hypothetical protein